MKKISVKSLFTKTNCKKSPILSLFYSTSVYEKNAHCTHKSAENSIKKNFNIQDKTKKYNDIWIILY